MSEPPASVKTSPPDGDAQAAFVYEEALRGLTQQQAGIQSLQARAATLIFAASFASSLLGSQALDDALGVWDWVALGLLFVIGALAVLMLWPYYNLSFRFDPEDLLVRYVDVAEPVPMAVIHRELRGRGRYRSEDNRDCDEDAHGHCLLK